ncbi:transglutaminase-like domain-containing protein [Methanococcus sp. CF]
MNSLKTIILALLIIASFAGCIDNLEPDVDTESDAAITNDFDSDNYTQIEQDTEYSVDDGKYLTEEYSWEYGGLDWELSLTVPEELYSYYKNKPRIGDYEQYALSDYDKTYLKSMITSFDNAADEKGYTKSQTVEFIVAFVQSLEYTSDKVTTGYDEYPRYPVETLMDNGGDCEDTAILTAALLHELGFGVVLIEFPGHMAVGVSGDSTVHGTYYEYNGKKYFYVETTGTGWEIGEIPEEYKDENATIYSMTQIPNMALSWDAEVYDYDSNYVCYRIYVNIENIGSGAAKNPQIYVGVLNLNNPGYAWDQTTLELTNYEEGSTGYAEVYLTVPRNQYSQLKIVLYGDNFESVESYSETFTT